MKLVLLESPYAGDRGRNVRYALRALRHSLDLDEAPIASHLLYTQVLDDSVREERALGMRAGLEWRRAAEGAVFYIDYGWSPGMRAAQRQYLFEGFPHELRQIGPNR